MNKYLKVILKIISVILIAAGLINIIFNFLPIINTDMVSKELIAQADGLNVNIYLIIGIIYGIFAFACGVCGIRTVDGDSKMSLYGLAAGGLTIVVLILQNIVLTDFWSSPLMIFQGLAMIVIYEILTYIAYSKGEKEYV